jgi:hypothetical protein
MHQTKTSSTPTKPQTLLGSLYVVQNAYHQRIESTPYVYRPNISLVGAIPY